MAVSFNVRAESEPAVNGENTERKRSPGTCRNCAHLFWFTNSCSQHPIDSVYWFKCRCGSLGFIRQAIFPPVFLPWWKRIQWGGFGGLQNSQVPSYPRRKGPEGAAAQIGNHLVLVDWILAADAKRKLQRHPGRPVVNLVSDPDLWHWIYFARQRRSWFILNCADHYQEKPQIHFSIFGGGFSDEP